MENKKNPKTNSRARSRAPVARDPKSRPDAAQDATPTSEKLQKVLARAGAGSRREMERWIEEGRVTVGGFAAKIGDRVLAGDVIRVDGRTLPRSTHKPRARVLVYHKPEGEVCTRSDPQGRPTVFDRLPALKAGRWIAVGRLDVSSSGVLLFTTDGELAHRLMHPSHEIEREYAVRILGAVDATMLTRLREGVALEDGMAHFDTITDAGGTGANHWYHVTLKEGRNREVRRMWDAVGAKVSRLIRVRYGPVMLPRLLRPGRAAPLEAEPLVELFEVVGLKGPVVPHRPPVRRRSGRAR